MALVGDMSRDAGKYIGLGGLAGLNDARHTVRVAFDFLLRKNEPSIGGIPFGSLAFVEFEDDGRVSEIALLGLAALGLEGAELVEGLLELTGEALAVETEGGNGLDQELRVRGVFEQ